MVVDQATKRHIFPNQIYLQPELHIPLPQGMTGFPSEAPSLPPKNFNRLSVRL